jgi:hypothetical protein
LNNNLFKGRASAAYERAMSDLECTSDDTWQTLLQDVLVRYVKLLTNPEGPAQSAPTLTRKEIIERDTARKGARAAAAAATAAAAAAADGGGDSGGDGGGDDDASGHGDEDEAAQPATAKAACCAAKGKAPAPSAAGRKKK